MASWERPLVGGGVGRVRGGGRGIRTGAFDIHMDAGAGCGPLPGGTNQMCSHHRKQIHRLSGEPRVLGNL